MKTIACLGPAGTFSELAFEKYLSLSEITAENVFFHSIHSVLTNLEQGKVDQAIVPVENSIEGTVNETLDFIVKSKKITICAEITIDIKQNLVGIRGTKLKDIKKVLSHPQALAQCSNYLRQSLPDVSLEATTSTASAVQYVKEQKTKEYVAIGNASVGLDVLVEGVNDNGNNQTRFLVLCRDNVPMTGDKVSIVFAIDADVPGGLYNILKAFSDKEINLTKIESRPTKEFLGHYLFFIDFQGDYEQEIVKKAISEVETQTSFFKILGIYKKLN